MAGTRFYPVLLGYCAQMTINETNNLIFADAGIREEDWRHLWRIIFVIDLCTTDERAFRTIGMVDCKTIRVRDLFSSSYFLLRHCTIFRVK